MRVGRVVTHPVIEENRRRQCGSRRGGRPPEPGRTRLPCPGLHRLGGDQDLIVRVGGVEHGGRDFLHAETFQKSLGHGQIAVRRNVDPAAGHHLGEQRFQGPVREPPVLPPPVHVIAGYLADPRSGRQEDAAGLEGVDRVAHGRLDVADHLERLDQDDAVVDAARYVFTRGQVAHDGGLGVVHHAEHVGPLHVATVFSRVPAVADFEHPAADEIPVGVQEFFDVVAVDREPAVDPEHAAARRRAAVEIVAVFRGARTSPCPTRGGRSRRRRVGPAGPADQRRVPVDTLPQAWAFGVFHRGRPAIRWSGGRLQGRIGEPLLFLGVGGIVPVADVLDHASGRPQAQAAPQDVPVKESDGPDVLLQFLFGGRRQVRAVPEDIDASAVALLQQAPRVLRHSRPGPGPCAPCQRLGAAVEVGPVLNAGRRDARVGPAGDAHDARVVPVVPQGAAEVVVGPRDAHEVVFEDDGGLVPLKDLGHAGQDGAPEAQVLRSLDRLHLAPVDGPQNGSHFLDQGSVRAGPRPVAEGVDEGDVVLLQAGQRPAHVLRPVVGEKDDGDFRSIRAHAANTPVEEGRVAM